MPESAARRKSLQRIHAFLKEALELNVRGASSKAIELHLTACARRAVAVFSTEDRLRLAGGTIPEWFGFEEAAKCFKGEPFEQAAATTAAPRVAAGTRDRAHDRAVGVYVRENKERLRKPAVQLKENSRKYRLKPLQKIVRTLAAREFQRLNQEERKRFADKAKQAGPRTRGRDGRFGSGPCWAEPVEAATPPKRVLPRHARRLGAAVCRLGTGAHLEAGRHQAGPDQRQSCSACARGGCQAEREGDEEDGAAPFPGEEDIPGEAR